MNMSRCLNAINLTDVFPRKLNTNDLKNSPEPALGNREFVEVA